MLFYVPFLLFNMETFTSGNWIAFLETVASLKLFGKFVARVSQVPINANIKEDNVFSGGQLIANKSNWCWASHFLRFFMEEINSGYQG